MGHNHINHQPLHSTVIKERIPGSISNLLQDPVCVVPMVYSMLLDSDKRVEAQQLAWISHHITPMQMNELRSLRYIVRVLDKDLRLPLLELLMPALRTLSKWEHRKFRNTIHELVHIEKALTPFDYCLHMVLVHKLDCYFAQDMGGANHQLSVRKTLPACETIIAVLSHQGSQAEGFNAGMQALLGRKISRRFPSSPNIKEFDLAIKKLTQAPPPVRKQLLQACAECMRHDDHVDASKAELLRALAHSLDCPTPDVRTKM